MKLGILYKDGKIINHRSFIKLVFNPIFRYFGFYIGSIFVNNEYKGVKFEKGQKTDKIEWGFNSWSEHDKLVKKRRFL